MRIPAARRRVPTTTATVPQEPAAGSVEEFTTMIGDRVFFGFDRYDLTAEAQAQLQKTPPG